MSINILTSVLPTCIPWNLDSSQCVTETTIILSRCVSLSTDIDELLLTIIST